MGDIEFGRDELGHLNPKTTIIYPDSKYTIDYDKMIDMMNTMREEIEDLREKLKKTHKKAKRWKQKYLNFGKDQSEWGYRGYRYPKYPKQDDWVIIYHPEFFSWFSYFSYFSYIIINIKDFVNYRFIVLKRKKVMTYCHNR